MCLSLILSNLSFALWPIYLIEFRDLWNLSNTDVGWISGSYFIGYLLLTPIYVGLTDKYDPKWIVIVASFSVSLGCLGLWFFAEGFWSTCFLWGIVGSGLAGTYMPGLQVLNSRLNMNDRVKLTPWYTSSFGISNGISFAVVGYIFSNFPWQVPNSISSDFLSLIIGIIMFLGMISSLLGAKFCLDYGRKRVLMIIGGSTFLFSIICALSVSFSLWLIIFLAGLYHFFIMLDSGALTAGTVSASDDSERGAILAVHSIIGFSGGAVAGPIIGTILDINGGTDNPSAWQFAFITMGLGSLLVFIIQYRSILSNKMSSKIN